MTAQRSGGVSLRAGVIGSVALRTPDRRRTPRGGEYYLACEPFRAPVEPHLAILGSYHRLYHARTKAFARWRVDLRATRLGPAEDEPFVCCPRPLDLHTALGRGESPVFGRVGCQLVQDHRNALGHIRLQQYTWSVNPSPCLLGLRIGGQLLRDEIA